MKSTVNALQYEYERDAAERREEAWILRILKGINGSRTLYLKKPIRRRRVDLYVAINIALE
jgi:hypothetical protein